MLRTRNRFAPIAFAIVFLITVGSLVAAPAVTATAPQHQTNHQTQLAIVDTSPAAQMTENHAALVPATANAQVVTNSKNATATNTATSPASQRTAVNSAPKTFAKRPMTKGVGTHNMAKNIHSPTQHAAVAPVLVAGDTNDECDPFLCQCDCLRAGTAGAPIKKPTKPTQPTTPPHRTSRYGTLTAAR